MRNRVVLRQGLLLGMHRSSVDAIAQATGNVFSQISNQNGAQSKRFADVLSSAPFPSPGKADGAARVRLSVPPARVEGCRRT